MSAKHTPGPWIAEVHASLDEAKDVSGFEWVDSWRWQSPPASVWLVAKGGGITGLPGVVETTAANANLIAAAPELLEALEELIACADTMGSVPSWTAQWDVARRAIAKAKGEA